MELKYSSTSMHSNEPSTYQICYASSDSGTYFLVFKYIEARSKCEAQQIAEECISYPYRIIYVKRM